MPPVSATHIYQLGTVKKHPTQQVSVAFEFSWYCAWNSLPWTSKYLRQVCTLCGLSTGTRTLLCTLGTTQAGLYEEHDYVVLACTGCTGVCPQSRLKPLSLVFNHLHLLAPYLFDSKGGACLKEPQNVLLGISTGPPWLDLQNTQSKTKNTLLKLKKLIKVTKRIIPRTH